MEFFSMADHSALLGNYSHAVAQTVFDLYRNWNLNFKIQELQFQIPICCLKNVNNKNWGGW